MDNISSNPFTGSFNIRVIRKYHNEATLRQILLEGANKKPYYDIDLGDRVSLYMNVYITEFLMQHAKPNTLKLYLHIIYRCLKKDQDFIDLKVKEIMEILGVSKNTVYTAVEQLCEFKVLAVRKGRNVYWINSELLFKGNRATYIDDNAPECVTIAKIDTQS